MRFLLLILLLGGASLNIQAEAQPRMSPDEYIRRFRDAAITDMQKTGVPASITLAQGMYESDYGNSPLARSANNHFGIKCHKEWNGPTYHQDDDAADECFRKYDDVQFSYDDHSNFLRSRDRYRFLFDLDITDYKGWAHGLKRAGYATNPQYAGRLIDLIEKYNLNDLDKQGRKIPADNVASTNNEPVTVAPVKEKPAAAVTTPAKTSVSYYTQKINDVPCTIARKGDSWNKIAKDHQVQLKDLLAFNDATSDMLLREGDPVFLKEKKNRSSDAVFHIIARGETMQSIAQLYGIKLSKLLKRNQMKGDDQPEAGQKIYLQMNKGFYE